MPADTEVPPIVQMTGITIRFPGVLALDGVDFRLRGGEIHSLMGENGAGKSTLIKALTGVYPIDSGTIIVAGEPRVFGSTADAQSAGISTVYQEVNLCANLSVGENVMLGHEPRAVGGIDWKAAHREAARHLENLGLHIDTRSALSSHSIAIQQLVAISRAMVLDAKVLILDEPTSSLDRGEVEQLFARHARPPRPRRRDPLREPLPRPGLRGLGPHHDPAQRPARRRVPRRRPPPRGARDQDDRPRARRARRHLVDDRSATIDRTGTPVLRATGVGRRGVLEPADIDVYEGEVVGIAGLLGSGRTELVRLLYGADRADSGQIEIDGTSRPDDLAARRDRQAHRLLVGGPPRPRASSAT